MNRGSHPYLKSKHPAFIPRKREKFKEFISTLAGGAALGYLFCEITGFKAVGVLTILALVSAYNLHRFIDIHRKELAASLGFELNRYGEDDYISKISDDDRDNE